MTTKRFLRFQIILLILLAVTLIGNTFSWATRPAVKGGGFMNSKENDYAAIKLETPDYHVNGNSCTAVTYMGTRNETTGEITYSEQPLSNNSFNDKKFVKSDVHYFKTVITNPTETATHVSLFVTGKTATTLTGARLGVSSPVTDRTSLFVTDNDTSDGYYNFEFIPVVSQFEVNSAKDGTNGTSSVEWYIFMDAGITGINEGELEISNIILSNN